MSSFLQADIFFFITTIAVIIFGVILGFSGYYLIKILKNLREMTDTVHEEVRLIKQDIDDLRSGVRDRLEVAERSPLTSIIGSVISHVRGNKPKRKTTRKRTTSKKK